MTPEQLDEIEKRINSTYPHQLLKAVREAQRERDEARAALDRVSSDDRMSEAQITAAITEAQKERDEARALLAALKAEHQPTDEMRSELLNEIEAHAETKAEVERLKAERDEARKWLEGICTEFESTIAHAEWRAAGSKGMSVPFHGDFADMTRHPGVIGRMRWWVKVFRAALKEVVP